MAFAQTRTGHSEDVLTFSLDVDDHKPHKLQSSKITSVPDTTSRWRSSYRVENVHTTIYSLCESTLVFYMKIYAVISIKFVFV